MKLFCQENCLEVGLDEVARGCLFGRVYAAAVIWPQDEELSLITKDSKKYTKAQREDLVEYIQAYAIDYAVGYVEAEQIDQINILQASYLAMKKALDQLNVEPEHLLVDGNRFPPYRNPQGDLIHHTCVVGGDATYTSIACASILAKVEHDYYIENLCQQYPELDSRYHLLSNMGYGSANHMNGLRQFGASQFHRHTFGLCQEVEKSPVCRVENN